MGSSTKAFVYSTTDFSDEEGPTNEVIAFRFKDETKANEFKDYEQIT